jgi:ABC-type glycerol-3-phosphate transport system permease component
VASARLRRRTRQLPAMLVAFFICFVFAIPFLWMILTSL